MSGFFGGCGATLTPGKGNHSGKGCIGLNFLAPSMVSKGKKERKKKRKRKQNSQNDFLDFRKNKFTFLLGSIIKIYFFVAVGVAGAGYIITENPSN